MSQKIQKRDRNVPPGVLSEARRTIVNKVTGESITWLKYGYETNGELSEATVDCNEGGGPPLHYHTTYNERFEAVEGQATIFVGDAKTPKRLNPGETAWVPMGTHHRFTSENGVIKMKGQVIPSLPGFERSLYILFGLAQDDQCNKEGLPNSIVQTAIISRMSDMKFPGLSGVFMNMLIEMFAWYGRVSGEEERLLQKYWD